jgi:hypothetical protein
MIISSVQIPGHFTYKAYIGKGNNGVLVRGVLKNRWWWTLADAEDSWEDVQMLWMQWRRAEFVKLMKTNQAELIEKELISPINPASNNMNLNNN